MRILTNPNLYRFTVVRNPWNRILSSYLDKHVKGGVIEHDRHWWNEIFFGRLPPGSIPGRSTDGLVEFGAFVEKCGQAIRRNRFDIDAHIAPQADMCALNTIKYDLIIPFKMIQEGVEMLAQNLRLRERNIPLPDIKSKLHATGSEKEAAKYQTPQSIEEVARSYYMDLSFPLNGVHFFPPEVAQQRDP